MIIKSMSGFLVLMLDSRKHDDDKSFMNSENPGNIEILFAIEFE